MVIYGIMNGSYTMMAKPMKTLELLYPMIHAFTINMVSTRVIFFVRGRGGGGGFCLFFFSFFFFLVVFF